MPNETVTLDSKREHGASYRIDFENMVIYIKFRHKDFGIIEKRFPLEDFLYISRIHEARRNKNKAIAEYEAILEGVDY